MKMLSQARVARLERVWVGAGLHALVAGRMFGHVTVHMQRSDERGCTSCSTATAAASRHYRYRCCSCFWCCVSEASQYNG